MAPALITGDAILIKKLRYNTLCFNSFRNVQLLPKKNDVIVFKLPKSESIIAHNNQFIAEYLVKRCFAAAGEYVLIKEKENCSDKDSMLFAPLFYNKKVGLGLSLIDTIWIPKKNHAIVLTCRKEKYYSNIFFNEGNSTTCIGDLFIINGFFSETYTFKENYYFMLGDNIENSIDSRHWGFVPEKNIVGKVVLVLFSFDPDAPWYSKFRWNRFLKRIN